MDKYQVATILHEIGTLLELQGENSFKCNAYHAAARTIEQLETELSDLITDGKLGELPGIGDALKLKITTLATTGSLSYYDELRQKFPSGLFEVLRVPGLGPKKAKALWEQLGVDTVEKLKAVCDAGTVAGLKGFGEKTQAKILEGLQFLTVAGNRVRLDQALPLGLNIVEALKKLPEVQRIELCGSLRRRRETIKDIDVLVSSKNAAAVMEHFVALPGVTQVVGQGDTKSSVVLDVGTPAHPCLINCDLRVVSDEQFPFALHYFTGSKEHNIAVRGRAQDYGLRLNEYALTGNGKSIKAKDEADIFKALDLAYIPPELREDTGEISAALSGTLPKLIEHAEINGVFHNHTRYSDGEASLEDMAKAAKKLGFKFLGIADHSRSLTIANGLSIERVREQHAEIDALNARLKGFHVFKGTECDILADGSLDYPDDVLASFDYVVASVHTQFNQPKEQMTARIIRALRNPHVTMLGHATGRLLLKRDGYHVDLDAILQTAVKENKMIEINAQPMRLELDWVHCKRAKALGVMLVINPDAHSTAELGYFSYGVDVARRGWLEKTNVFNTRTVDEVKREFTARRKRSS